MTFIFSNEQPIPEHLREKIEGQAQKDMARVNEYLPVTNLTIIFRNSPQNAIPEYGVGGYSPSGTQMYVSFDVEHTSLDKAISTHLLRTLAHEYHHVVRWRGPGYGITLREALVSEGLADHFEIAVSGGEPAPWDKALSQKEIEQYMERAKKEWDAPTYDEALWFYGIGELPRWTGYTLGFEIVKQYLEAHPTETAVKHVHTPANNFV